jgi:arylsulfatase A-like enzyme
VGKVVENLKANNILDNTLVVITSDHGEEFMEHGQIGHLQQFEEVLRVPLIIRFPKNFPIVNRVIENEVQHIDLLPSLLDILELSSPFFGQGKSWVNFITKSDQVKEKDRASFAFSKTLGVEKFALKVGNRKIMGKNGVVQFVFDLDKDPREEKNLLKTTSPIDPDYLKMKSVLRKEYLYDAL